MNYLLAENIMIERLKECIPGIPVRVADDLEDASDQSAGKAEIFVMFARDVVVDTAGGSTLLEQQFAAVLIEPSLLRDRAATGLTLAQITKALAGYEPADQSLGEFKRVGSMSPQTWSTGITAYGMLFSVSLNM